MTDEYRIKGISFCIKKGEKVALVGENGAGKTTFVKVFNKYISLAENKTVIMVTHRISVAALADRIVVFKDGSIVEDGSHEELMTNNGEYARLYSTQAQWYDR